MTSESESISRLISIEREDKRQPPPPQVFRSRGLPSVIRGAANLNHRGSYFSESFKNFTPRITQDAYQPDLEYGGLLLVLHCRNFSMSP